MENELIKQNDLNLEIWTSQSSLKDIKEVYGKNLNDIEWKLFVSLGIFTGLNPFLNEIFPVKYGDKKANIYIGRDGYRKIALQNNEYDYHFADCVYENDKFKVTNGKPEHEYSIGNRGKLIGAYCIVKRKSSSQPNYNYVSFKEYDLQQATWKDKPETMIKKVAESQTLRMTFPNSFNGTYDESEQWIEKEPINITPKQNAVEKPIEQTDKERKLFHALLNEYKLDKDKVKEYLIEVNWINDSTKEIVGKRLDYFVDSIKSGKFLVAFKAWLEEKNKD